MAAFVLHLGQQDAFAFERRGAGDPAAFGQHADDFRVRVLADLPDERLAIPLRHPVLRFDEVPARELGFEFRLVLRISLNRCFVAVAGRNVHRLRVHSYSLRPSINDAFGFAHRTFDRHRHRELRARRQTDIGLDRMLELLRSGAPRILAAARKLRPHFHVNRQFVQIRRPRDFECVMRFEFGLLQNQLFDLCREQIDAANDQHVVRAAGDLLDAPHAA